MPDDKKDFSDFYISEPQESVRREEQRMIDLNRKDYADVYSNMEMDESGAAAAEGYAAGSRAQQKRTGDAGSVNYNDLLTGDWDATYDAAAGAGNGAGAGQGTGQVTGAQNGATGNGSAETGRGTYDPSGFTDEEILRQGQGTGEGDAGTETETDTHDGDGNGDGNSDVTGDTDAGDADAALTRAERVSQYWQGAENQTYDELMKYLDELDRQDEKRRRSSNWWELMARGLTGAANLAGAAAGAPSLDLSDSKDAFTKADNDAYARLKDRKQQAIQLAQKRMEMMEKQREASRKAYADETSYQIKLANLERQAAELELKKAKAQDEHDKTTYDIELKKTNEAIAQLKLDHLPTQYALEDGVRRSTINRNNRSGSGSGGRGGSGKTIIIAGKDYKLGTGKDTWFEQQARLAGFKKSGRFKKMSDVYDYIADPKNANDSRVKKLKKLLGI